MAKFQKTSKHYGGNPLYQKLVYIAQNSDTRKKAAERLGISPSTLYRWIRFGVPEKVKFVDLKSTAARVYKNTRATVKRRLQRDEYYEPKTIHFYRYFGGVRSKYYLVQNHTYEQMLEIIMRECEAFHDGKINYAGFRFRLKLTAPFEGLYDGDGNFTDDDELAKMTPRERRMARSMSSWIKITIENPYLSSRVFPFQAGDGMCRDPAEYEDNLYKFFHTKNMQIEEIIFSEIRGDEYGNKIDFYNM